MKVDRLAKNQAIPMASLPIWMGMTILLFDQLTKGIVFHYLPIIHSSPYVYPYGGIGLFKDFFSVEFSLNHMTNSGAAWGLFGQYQLPLIVLRIFLIAGLLLYLFQFNQDKKWQLPLVLIISGAIGNVCDFFIYGHVIDMIHFVIAGFDFPIFNIADASISIGIGWLFFISLIRKK